MNPMPDPRLDALWNGWTPPAELAATPRQVKLTGFGIAFVVLSLVLALGGIGIAIWLWTGIQSGQTQARLMQTEGREIQGVVQRLWQSGGKHNQNMVAYDFAVAGVTAHSEIAIAADHWRALAAGSPIKVRYLPSNPGVNYPASDPPEAERPFAVIIFVVYFLGVASVFPFMIRREWRLLREGQPAPSMVTGNRRARGANFVRYQFALPGGEVFNGCGKRSFTEPGSTICILYNPRNPRRNLPYPARLVKLKTDERPASTGRNPARRN